MTDLPPLGGPPRAQSRRSTSRGRGGGLDDHTELDEGIDTPPSRAINTPPPGPRMAHGAAVFADGARSCVHGPASPCNVQHQEPAKRPALRPCRHERLYLFSLYGVQCSRSWEKILSLSAPHHTKWARVTWKYKGGRGLIAVKLVLEY